MRHRNRGDKAPDVIVQGDSYFDTTLPFGDGPWYHSSTYKWKSYSTELYTYQEECWDELHPGPPYRSGGPLNKYLFETDQYTLKGPVDARGWKYRYVGGHLPSYWPSNFLSQTFSGFQDAEDSMLLAEGATGWKRSSPTKPRVDTGVAIAELRELPRMLRTTAKGFADLWRSLGGSKTYFGPKKVADHWLNHQFGWLPFLSDLRGLYKLTKNLDKELKQLARDNGQWIKRACTLTNSSDSQILVNDNRCCSPVVNTYCYSTPAGQSVVTKTTSERTWFEARFRYHIPGHPGSWQWNSRAISMLYGIQISPSLLWEITPWSWLIDWVSNAGDVISNISQITINDLCAKYAYVMSTKSERVDVYQISNYRNCVGGGNWYALLERKCRYGASPFGFGLTGADFSARQWSILSALGLSRLKW